MKKYLTLVLSNSPQLHRLKRDRQAVWRSQNTVRHWVKNGLTATDDKRPMLISVGLWRPFLQIRREKQTDMQIGNSTVSDVILRNRAHEGMANIYPSPGS